MRINPILLCLLIVAGIAKAQHQNFELKEPDTDTANQTYTGRDYVRLLPGYTFSAISSGKTMTAKVSSALTTEEANALLAKTYKNGNWDYLTSIDTNLNVGVIPITSSISPTGAKTYNVPIEIVAGRMGFQPTISLSYNSQDGNGVVGMGWNIAGLSCIDRVDQNLYYDNKCGTIDFTTNDKFVLNGERLLQLSKSSTQIEYETSTGNTFVTAYISGEIVKYFKVRYPNGVIGIFGFTTNTASKLAYPITKLTDAIGINISFSYIEDSNTYYIDKIRYGGRGEIGEAGYMSDFAKIQFTYTDNRIDVISQYVVDKTVKMTKILDKIECYANSEVTPEKTYDINYINTDNRIQNSPPTGVSQLMKISCTANNELNSLKFIYGENVSPAIIKKPKSFTGQSFDLKNTNALIGNFHDKNRNDALIFYPKAEIYQQGAHYDYTPVYPADKEIKIYNIQNEQLSTVTPLTTGAGFLSLLTIDVDNDGLDEVVKINTSGNVANNEVVSYSIYKPDESFGLSLQRTETKNYNIYISESYFDYSNYDWVDIYSIDYKKFYVGNFSGNGKSEILCVSGTNNVSIISFENSINVIYSNQNLFNHISNLIYPLDIDGDGQTEVLVIGNTKTNVYKYKSGAGFQDIADWALTSSEFSERQIMFADLNEDGNIDIVKSPQQNTVDVEYETRKARAWMSSIAVNGAFVECDKCHYPQIKAYIDVNDQIVCRKHIGVESLNGKKFIIDTDYQPAYNLVLIYPRIKENHPDSVESLCPGCDRNITYALKKWDGKNCWVCNESLHKKWFFLGHMYCWNHGDYINRSNWSWTLPVSETPIMYDNWIYQYTNGKTIIQTDTITGIMRANDYKFSIHEINGDGVPDLIYQNDAGNVVVCPFNIKTRSFVMGNQTTDGIPLSFELFDVNMNDDYKNSNLLALGSNKIVNIKFPYNHTRDNMVSLMVNSLGVVDKTEYTQLTDKAHYTRGEQAQFPYYDFSGPMWVVSNNSQLADKKVTSSVDYNYAGGIFHNMGLDFLGFSSLASTNLMTNKVNTTEFDPYKQGALIKNSSDTEEINIEYNYTVATNKKTTLLPLKKIITDKLKGNTVTVTYPLADYDSYGNAKKEIIDYGGGILTTIEKSIDNRIGTRCFIGLLSGKFITNERNGQFFEYGEEYQHLTNGKLHYKWDYLGVDNTSQTEYIYDNTYGTLTSEIVTNYLTNDQLTTSYIYWDNDKCSLRKITDPLNRVTEYSYNFTKRLLTESKDDYGKTTVYGYDDWRRLNKITRPDGTVTDITVNWNSGDDPKYLMKETTISTGQPTAYKLTDAFGRVTRSSVAGFDANTEVLSDSEYDSFGRLYTSSAPYKSSETPLLNTYSYDKFDRIEKILAFNGGETSYSYSGNKVTTTTDGVITSKTYDATGKLVGSTDAGGTVTYTYRADGQPDKINTAGVETSFEYNDPFNRQTKLIDPNAGTIETQYDDANRKVKQIWNSGKEITTEFNTKGQVLAKYTPDFTAVYGYEKGKFKNVTYYGNSRPMSKSITYDDFGRLWKENEMVDGKTLEQEFLYDLGKLSSVSYTANTGSNSLTYNIGVKFHKVVYDNLY